ncbi:hypothetical protein [Streptomyces subrutilus]|uniref:hypothetical protein n=1 Tax=Streptomyces subrutilus TaxID=36818 RepID=UPI00340C7269
MTDGAGGHMKATGLLLGLAPWVLFALVVERLGADSVGWAALLACLASVTLILYGLRNGSGVKVIELTGAIAFAILAAVGFYGSNHTLNLLADYGRGGSVLLLSVVMFISAFTIPFTEQYAHAFVDQRYWGTPRFRQVNRRASLMWSGIIFVMAVCHLISGALQSSTGSSPPPGHLLLNWVIPIILIIVGVKRTNHLSEASP